jgi:hypothetical protein
LLIFNVGFDCLQADPLFNGCSAAGSTLLMQSECHWENGQSYMSKWQKMMSKCQIIMFFIAFEHHFAEKM